jgi:hypothetical protein
LISLEKSLEMADPMRLARLSLAEKANFDEGIDMSRIDRREWSMTEMARGRLALKD